MKFTHIIGIIVIAVAAAVIISGSMNASTYADFSQATQKAASGDFDDVHVVGKLKKDGFGKIVGMSYQPELDANRFEFVLLDNKGQERQVIYSNAKPQDFEKSEQIVVIGNMRDGKTFKANQILMKCPSKYQEEESEFKPAQPQANLK
ncbi:MAG: cytochrome c maturation protein CcmE [Verrucomicrobia bacterium]|nr:cytochrome c maturation protein CcmE [Cytophagales bacterium]